MTQNVEDAARIARRRAKQSPHPTLLAMAIAVASVLPFVSAVEAGFVHVDLALVPLRPFVQQLSNVPRFFVAPFWTGVAPGIACYRPLVNASYALDFAVWSGDPFGFHATSVLLHGLAAALVFATLRRWGGGAGLAALLTLLWAFHPTKVDAVVSVAARGDLLAAIGLLIALLGTSRRQNGARRSGLALEIAGIAFAMLAKESAFVAPAFVALEACVGGRRRGCPSGRRLARFVAPSVAVVAVITLVHILVVTMHGGVFPELFSLRHTLLGFSEALRLLVVPVRLSTLHLERADGPHPWPAFAFVLVLGLALALCRRRGRAAAVLLLGSVALLPLLLPFGSEPSRLVAERALYVPSLAVVGVLAVLVPARGRLVVSFPAIAAIVVCGALAKEHVPDFRDVFAFWAAEARADPSAPLARQHLAELALRRRQSRRALGHAFAGLKEVDRYVGVAPVAALALAAAEAEAKLTSDGDREGLRRVDAFFQALFAHRSARLRTHVGELSVAPDAPSVRSMFGRDRATLSLAYLSGARAAVRVGDCTRAVELARGYFGHPQRGLAKLPAVLVLARCGVWRSALDAARAMDAEVLPSFRIASRLESAQSVLGAPGEDIEAVVARAQALDLLGDNVAVTALLAPRVKEVSADRDHALLLARASVLCGDEAATRAAFFGVVSPGEAGDLRERWLASVGRR